MLKGKVCKVYTRVTPEVREAINALATAERPPYVVVRDIIVSYVMAAKRPPLRDDTMALLYKVATLARYDSVDAMIADLCRSFERTMRAARGELDDSEASVDNDIAEMFSEVLNEKEIRIRKHA